MTAKATGNVKKVKGLQLTTAQQAAYNKVYAATATKIRTKLAIASAAQGLRKYRLQAAASLVKKAHAAQATAQTAAIAAQATHRTYVQSRLAHQNSALQARIELDMSTHALASGRAQYIAAGEKAYAHSAVMATLTNAQATTIEAKAYKTAKKASKSTLPATKFKPGPNSAAISAAASAAGAAAAKKVPASAVAKTAGKARTAPNYGNVPHPQSTAMAQAMYVAHTRTKDASKKHVLTEVKWHGDDVTPNCVITAVANHLLHIKNFQVSERNLEELSDACHSAPTIEEVLWTVWNIGWPGKGAHLKNYKPAPPEQADDTVLVIGYEATCDDGTTGDHAALSLGAGKVVSWGKVIDGDAVVEEAWDLEWEC